MCFCNVDVIYKKRTVMKKNDVHILEYEMQNIEYDDHVKIRDHLSTTTIKPYKIGFFFSENSGERSSEREQNYIQKVIWKNVSKANDDTLQANLMFFPMRLFITHADFFHFFHGFAVRSDYNLSPPAKLSFRERAGDQITTTYLFFVK